MFENYKLLEALMIGTWLLFAFAFGSCLGSLINVLVYRLPLGLDVVSPASRCPSCNTLLTWRENIPVFGWLMLKGRCRFCKERISPEYPIVEAFVGFLFVLLYALWFVLPQIGSGEWLGVDWAAIAPEWARNGMRVMWPTYVMTVLLLGSLVAMTLIDARTFHIPLVLTWIPIGLGIVGHTLHAAWIGGLGTGGGTLKYTAAGHWWVIPTVGPRGWELLGLSVGGCTGLIVAWGLQKIGVFKQSYADFADWEASVEQAAGEDDSGTADDQAQLWIQYPHARRESLRELLWLSPAIILGALGVYLLRDMGLDRVDMATGLLAAAPAMPLWLSVLGGTLLGVLGGGGLIWGIRIFGSLAFGKEAMGMGDVWLMAAVGACLGWMDATLIFFVAPFVALLLTAWLWLFGGKARRAMPYGPALAVATLMVVVGERGFEWALGRLWGLESAFVLP